MAKKIIPGKVPKKTWGRKTTVASRARKGEWKPARIEYREKSSNPYVYSTKGKYLGTYKSYRAKHPGGSYTQIMRTEAQIKLSKAQIAYLVGVDREHKK